MANEVARSLRKKETIAERKLWKALRMLRGQGYHFRRQCPIDGYIVDCACLSQRLIVEVDGCHHLEGEQRRADEDRDAHLHWQGYSVLRFGNSDVMENLDSVMREVLAALGAVARIV